MKIAHRAKLVIHEADRLKTKDLRILIEWLRETAKFLKKDGDNLSRRFTARLMR